MILKYILGVVSNLNNFCYHFHILFPFFNVLLKAIVVERVLAAFRETFKLFLDSLDGFIMQIGKLYKLIHKLVPKVLEFEQLRGDSKNFQ